MVRRMRLLAVVAAVLVLPGCATIAGGPIDTGVGVATGHPVFGALVGMVWAYDRQCAAPMSGPTAQADRSPAALTRRPLAAG